MSGVEEADERLRAVAAEFGGFFADKGLTPSFGQILGWLIVCDPPEQSVEQLMTALGISRGGISMAMRMAQNAGVVERVSMPGSRAAHYRLRSGFWLREADEKAEVAAQARKMAEHALEAVGDRDESGRRRAQEMHDMYAFLEQEYARIRDRWHEHQQRPEETR